MSGAAERMAAQMSKPDFAGAWGAELLVSVPMHPSRQRNRGYNQAAALCTAIHERSGIPMAAALQRKQLHEAQARLSAEQRWINVRGAFAPGTAVVHGHVLLVDDVCTTGATLEECACVLKHMGAECVTGLVFARA
jgi:ComF family protein